MSVTFEKWKDCIIDFIKFEYEADINKQPNCKFSDRNDNCFCSRCYSIQKILQLFEIEDIREGHVKLHWSDNDAFKFEGENWIQYLIWKNELELSKINYFKKKPMDHFNNNLYDKCFSSGSMNFRFE